MATLLSDLKTRLAHRMGEDSAPSDSNEEARRLTFLNEAYRDIMRRHYWWFSETTGQFTSVANQASYSTADGVPSDIRAILELRFQGKLYTPCTQYDAMSTDTTPYKNMSQGYFMFAGSIYFVPPLSSAVSNGVTLKYYKKHTALSANGDAIIIPDDFSDALIAYTYGRLNQIEGERGSASDGFEEYKEIVSQMDEEQNKYLFALKSSGADIESMFP